MSRYLIKRSSKIIDGGEFSYQLNDGWYAEVQQKRPMFSEQVKKDDIIYVAESQYAIFGCGVVEEKTLVSFDNLQEFFNHILSSAKTRHDRFWFNKMKDITEKYKGGKIWVLEFKLKNSDTFEMPYLLEKRFLQRNSWYKLEEDFEISQIQKINSQLHGFIPTNLRKSLFHKYKLQGKEHLIDIDHHVPNSLNGPGNIEENLIPLSIFQNRSKSDAVPSKLFSYGKDVNIKIPEGTKIDPKLYYSSGKHKLIAKQIIEIINKDFDLAKNIYKEIKLYHFPNCL
jgi:hypothetical protein